MNSDSRDRGGHGETDDRGDDSDICIRLKIGSSDLAQWLAKAEWTRI